MEEDAEALKQRRSGRIHAGVGASHAKTGFAQHSRHGRHRRAANGQKVDVVTEFQGSDHSTTAGSRISKAPAPRARSRALTPRGKVSIGRSVWPTGAPQTTGTPSGSSRRRHTSATVQLPGTPGAHSGKSPRITPRMSENN